MIAQGTAPRAHPIRATLRLRLTLWVIAICAVIELSLGLVVLLHQRTAINTFFNDRLSARAAAILADVRPRLPGLTGSDLAAIATQQSNLVVFDSFIIAVYDADGALVDASVAGMRPLTRAQLARLASESPLIQPISESVLPPNWSAGGDPRAALRFVRAADGKQYILACITADTYARRMLALVTQLLLVLLPIGLVAAGISGWYIAGVAVAPIAEARAFARRLSPSSLGDPVDVHSTSPEVRQLEEELEDARTRIAAGFKAQERFISNVSHELKTPVSVVLTEAETLDLTRADRDVRDFVASVGDEMRRLGSMIESFLLLTRTWDGRSATVTRRYLVNEMLMDSVQDCLPMAEQYRVRLIPLLLSADDELDAKVNGDPDLLRTMLNNLIRNAVRFSPESDSVHVTAFLRDDDACVAVADNGPGIPDQLLPHIFDRFAQADGELRRGRGHGLGLEISQGIAELHGGRITARNRPTRGCEFEICIPRAAPA